MVLEVVCGVACCSVFWKNVYVLLLVRMDPIIPVGFIAHHALKSLWGICLKRNIAFPSEKVTSKLFLVNICCKGDSNK